MYETQSEIGKKPREIPLGKDATTKALDYPRMTILTVTFVGMAHVNYES